MKEPMITSPVCASPAPLYSPEEIYERRALGFLPDGSSPAGILDAGAPRQDRIGSAVTFRMNP
jgi:hypothetical protein